MTKPPRHLIIGVDFDGTIVEHDYPRIGPPIPEAIETLRECAKRGAKLILWTMRSGVLLDEAVDYLTRCEVSLFGVNRNPDQDGWSQSPKAYCHVYVDDAALGCPLEIDEGRVKRPMVHWPSVAPYLFSMIATRWKSCCGNCGSTVASDSTCSSTTRW